MEEIKVGEYVRTKRGIAQITDLVCGQDTYFDTENIFESNDIDFYRNNGIDIYGSFFRDLVVKHSKQQIDLIEVGDIVNRHLIIDKYVDVDEYGNDFWCLIIEDDSLLNKTIREEDIQTILTKESYMANCYKLKRSK